MGPGSGILPGVRPPPLVAIPTALSGPRVLLRPYRLQDAAAFLEAIEESRAHLEPWLPWVQGVRSLADARADLAKVRSRWRARVELTVGIFHRETGRLLGGSGRSAALNAALGPSQLLRSGSGQRENRFQFSTTMSALDLRMHCEQSSLSRNLPRARKWPPLPQPSPPSAFAEQNFGATRRRRGSAPVGWSVL